MLPKYQIFISSTYEDLKTERDIAIKAILEMGHLPVGMEMFSAADEDQWKLITRQIDECDYYIVIVAHRYGSVDGDISYTEKEYNYAAEQGIPILGFLIDDNAHWPKTKMDSDTTNIRRLKLFKEKIKAKHIGIWKNADDLYGKLSIALMKEISINPRVGWIKASHINSSPATTNELTRLSKENADLREQLRIIQKNESEKQESEDKKVIEILRNNTTEFCVKYKGSDEWQDHQNISLYNIFTLLAPQIVPEQSADYIRIVLAVYYCKGKSKNLDTNAPAPKNTLSDCLSDLSVMGLIEPSKERHLLSDENQYWTLSEYGRKIYNRIRRRQLEMGISESTQSSAELPDMVKGK